MSHTRASHASMIQAVAYVNNLLSTQRHISPNQPHQVINSFSIEKCLSTYTEQAKI